MLVEFECTNISQYDAATGRYVACGNRLVVGDDQIGEMVDCPKCQQKVEVPFDVGSPAARPETSKERKRPSVATTKSKKRPMKKKPTGRRINEQQLEQPVSSGASDVMSFDFENHKTSTIHKGNEERCPKCGSPMASGGSCSRCRFVTQKFESATLPLEKLELKCAGFQKWFCDIVSEGVSMRLLEIGLHGMAGVLFTVLFVTSILIGGKTVWAGGVFLVIAAVTYIAWVIKGHDLRKNPKAQLAWFQKPVWYLVLASTRSMNWQGYDKRFKDRKIIDRRNAPLQDENLPVLEGLKNCSVLDLEGTMISDRALRCLYGHKHLRCLVVKRTKVTAEGVQRLQQANPRLWIWS